MGTKLLFTGLTVIIALPVLIGTSGFNIAGAFMMIIGAVLIVFDK